jgi:hypothetical protein
MAAMTLEPDNGSVMSLLGDIYENQGKLSEAIQWYRMALDANPDSPADKMKLSNALSLLEISTVAKAPEVLAGKTSVKSTASKAIDLSPALNHNVLTITLRIAAYMMALAFAVVVGYSLTSSIPRNARFQANGGYKNFETDPILVQTSGDASTTFLPNARDAAELKLLTTLAADPTLTGSGMSVSDVSDDPRTGQITVTGLFTQTDMSFNSRSQIMRAALKTAMETSTHTDSGSAMAFTIRVLVANTTTGSDELTFTGDVSRSTLIGLTSDPSSIPDGQLASKFDNPWWSTDFAG